MTFVYNCVSMKAKIKIFVRIKELESYLNSFPEKIINKEIKFVVMENYIYFCLILDYKKRIRKLN